MAFAFDFSAMLAVVSAVPASAQRRVGEIAERPPSNLHPLLARRRASLRLASSRESATPVVRAPDQSAPLQVAFLILIDRALSAAHAKGASACAEHVNTLLAELRSTDPASVILRSASPEIASGESAAARMIEMRCAACLNLDCARAQR